MKLDIDVLSIFVKFTFSVSYVCLFGEEVNYLFSHYWEKTLEIYQLTEKKLILNYSFRGFSITQASHGVRKRKRRRAGTRFALLSDS